MSDDYYTRPSLESALLCAAICFAGMIVLSVIAGVLAWIK